MHRFKKKKVLSATMIFIIFALCLYLCSKSIHKAPVYTSLTYQPAPYENPLRGLVYNYQSEFPQSLTYLIVPFNEFYDNFGNITFESFDTSLLNIAQTGCHAVVRIFINYPGNPDSSGLYLPQYIYDNLWERGKIFIDPDGGKFKTPDYGDEFLLNEISSFIKIFGDRYDGHPAIGFIQLGLIGNWGEWNFAPFDDKMTLTDDKYNQIYEAFENAFPSTLLMARNPLLGNPANYNLGFHDDNFLYNTVSMEPVTEDNINQIAQFQYMMEMSGTHDRWKTAAYGGELSGATDMLFYKGKGLEYYTKSMEVFHFSFLSLPIPQTSQEDKDTALESTRLMGYELCADKVSLSRKKDRRFISISLKNTGNAPFYYNWDFEIRIVDKTGKIISSHLQTGYIINDILPGESKFIDFELNNTIAETHEIHLSIVNPIKDLAKENFKPLYLANTRQKGDGFILLGEC